MRGASVQAGLFLALPFCSADDGQETTHGNFVDCIEIVAGSCSAEGGIVGGKVERAMLGREQSRTSGA